MNKNLIDKIKELLTDEDHTQKQLAEAIGVSESGISNVLKGSREMTIEELMKTSEFLGVGVEYLLGLSSEMDEETHRARLLIDLFSHITTTEQFSKKNKAALTPSDLAFSKGEKYTVLIGSVQLFSLIDRVADLNSRKKRGELPENEFNDLIEKAWRKFRSNKDDKNKDRRFLISPEQFQAEEEKTKNLAKLLDYFNSEE